MSIKKTTEEFISEAVSVHANKYDYSKIEYVNAKTKVCIICPEHGEFWQTPSSHLSGSGCPKCAGKNKTTEEFIRDAKEVHGDRYDYSKVEYSTTHENISIICIEHGVFKQTPDNHLRGKGCPKCAEISRSYRRYLKAKIRRNWDFEQPEDYKLIPLTQGKFAMVDNEDFDRVKEINWCYTNGYANNTIIGLMHRYIMNAPDHLEVDHIVQEATLDNRKSNLRLATSAQNSYNQKPLKGSSSSYKGVSWNKMRKKWCVNIGYRGRSISLGYFENEGEAAKAYDKKALELFGEFAYLNFPELKEEYLKEFEQYIK